MASSAPDPAPPVLVRTSDGIATVTLNRPTRRNAASWDLVTGLLDALEQVRDDANARVLVLTGAGGDFSVGADLARVSSDERSAQETRTLRGRSLEDDHERLAVASTVTERLVTFPKPTIAAVDGACAGAGLSIALATDLQVASSDAVLVTAFVSAGVSGDLGSAWLLSRAVGPARARSLLLDPRRLTGAEAAAIGLLTEATDDLPGRVHELATKLARQAPLAMRLAKLNVADAMTSTLTDYLRAEVPRMVESARSKDARAAARAFIERRAPEFTGE
ncbi:enoyl-CoA hydratase/isomerase family protein [Aeromicrobium terrae]|nr:enoyl-CoA hydratase-related protein [Aeromicrobium terrae]